MSGRSLTAELGGPVHYVEFAGRPDGPRIVLVHGLGGSHLNWSLVAPGLAERARVWAIDLPGFGLSEPGTRSAAVEANVAVLDRFVHEVVGAPVVLVGNSMGGMISILEAAGSADMVTGLVLVDPALPQLRTLRIDPAIALRFALFALPGVGARSLGWRRRLIGARKTVLKTMAVCGLDQEVVPDGLLARDVALIEGRRDPAAMDRAFVAAAVSILRIAGRPRRYLQAMDALTMPVLLLHGGRDRLVPVEAARVAARRHRQWRLEVWPEAGHVPQIQMPERFVELVGDWLDTDGADAAAHAAAAPSDR
jgi:pimeloyl-ACP methyl ester carboxylesterase